MTAKTPAALALASLVALAAGVFVYTRQAPPPASVAAPEPGPVHAAAGALSDTLPAGLVLNDLDGKPHRLEDYRGKLVVLNFWATWCGPCLHEIPALIKLQGDYGAKGLQLLGPAVDDPDEVRAQAGKLGFNYPVFVGESEAMLDLMTRLGNTAGALPFSVVIGPDGRIVSRQLGEYAPVELAGLVETELAKAH